MKKRYKAIMIIVFGALIYGIGILLGVSFLASDYSQKNQSDTKISKPSSMPQELRQSTSQWQPQNQSATEGSKVNTR